MNKDSIIHLRMERQHFLDKINNYEEYIQFFRLIQPVAPIYFSEPGDAPTLIHRTTFDNKHYNDQLRSKRKILKGRFQNGNVGYVYFDDFELYLAAYKKEITLEHKHDYILRLLRQEGPLTCHQIKESSGLLSKEIMPVLHDLQKAFIVYEDQVDSDWERSWYLLENELGVNIHTYTKETAITLLIKKALYLLVAADINMLKGWLKFTTKDLKQGLVTLLQSNEILEINMDGEKVYCLIEDYHKLNSTSISKPIKSVFVLHRSDFLVKAFETQLKQTFQDREILQYLLIDGEFKGAVCGHWRIGPYDVEDIVLTLSETEKQERKTEIIDAVKLFYSEPFSKLLKYDGKDI